MHKDIFDYFDERGLDKLNTVVRCPDQETAGIFLEYLCAKGVWNKVQIKTLIQYWTDYRDTTCYHLCSPEWCNVGWYKQNRPNYIIVDFDDIYIGDVHEVEVDCVITFDEIMQGVKTP